MDPLHYPSASDSQLSPRPVNVNGHCFRWPIPTRLIPLTAKVLAFNNGLTCLHAAWKAEDPLPDLSRFMQGVISIIFGDIEEDVHACIRSEC